MIVFPKKILGVNERREILLLLKVLKSGCEGKVLGKIEINVVYIPTPLKRETLTLPEKVE